MNVCKVSRSLVGMLHSSKMIIFYAEFYFKNGLKMFLMNKVNFTKKKSNRGIFLLPNAIALALGYN